MKNIFKLTAMIYFLNFYISAPCLAAVTETQTTVNIHQGITSDGFAWYGNGTISLHKWNAGTGLNVDPDISRTDLLNDDTDFIPLGIDHWGAPFVYNGFMYTVAKHHVSCGSSTNHYLVKYDTADLSYAGKVPIGDGFSYQVSGGPVIKNINGTDYFFLIKCGEWPTNPDTIYKFRLSDGKYCDGVNCPYGDISLTGRLPNKTQGIFQDNSGNWLVAQGYLGIAMYSPSGVYEGDVFKVSPLVATYVVHEGFYLDINNNLSVAMTYMNPPAPHTYKVLQANLDTDVYRYVNGINGSSSGTGYTPTDAIDTVDTANHIMVPGMTLLIKGFGPMSPLRTSLRPFPGTANDGVAGYPVTYEGDGEYVYVTGSLDVSESEADTHWNPSQVSGEYFLTSEALGQKTGITVTSLSASSPIEWATSGMDGLGARTEGILGILSGGGWAWGDNDGLGFDTLYYNPASGENIATVHIEANQNDPVVLSRNYWSIRNIKTFFGGGASVRVTGSNCSIEQSQFSFGLTYGVEIQGPNALVQNVISTDSGTGFYVLDQGDNASLTNCVAYHNANEGFLVRDGAQSVTIRNCIASHNGGAQFSVGSNAQASLFAEYNDWYGANNTYFDSYLSGHDVGNLNNVDPEFVDAANNDFHLTPCSPAVDAGDSTDGYFIEPNPNGGRINLGAYGNTLEAAVSPNPTDSDSDGVVDLCDNCINKPNGPLTPDAGGNTQLDTDNDGYGNMCDGDLDGDNVVGVSDFNVFRATWLTSIGNQGFDPDCDFNGDGVVGVLDFNIFRDYWLKGPGPSGLVP